MPITLQIPVPNISSLIATYDVIRVFRSTSTRDGPFVEVTASAASGAVVTGTVADSFTSLNGKTIIFRVTSPSGTIPDIPVTFSDSDPISTAQAVVAIASAASGILTAADDGSGHVQVTTVGLGSGMVLEVVGGSGLADMGFALYQRDSGEDPFIPLTADDTLYQLVDPTGSENAWYRWQFYNTGTLASSAVVQAIQPQTARIDPVKKLEDFRATRGLTLIRSREHTFRMAFWEDQAAGVPLVPFDASRYPSYAIFDPNGTTIQTGKAEVDGQTPNYKVPFTPAIDAILTNDDRRWRIDWFMLTDVGRSVQTSELFDMRDVDITEAEVPEQKVLALDDKKKRLRLPLPKRPVSIELMVKDANNPTILITPLAAVFPPSGPNPSITEIQNGDQYVYVYDIPPDTFTAGHTYQAVWSVLPTPVAEEDQYRATIEVPPFQLLQHFDSLRMLLDKFKMQKNMSIQAYQESDIYEYLKRGSQIINSLDPVHLQWQITQIPEVVQPWWLFASTFYGLQAQGILETYLQFNFSGQSVTLDYDHAGQLDAIAQKMWDTLITKFTATKKQLYRKQASVGNVSVRPMRRLTAHSLVFRVSADSSGSMGSGNSIMALMSSVGLLGP